MLYDLPLEELKKYRPERFEPGNFDQFWNESLASARKSRLEVRFEPIDSGLSLVDTFDVTYNGYGGQPIKGWLILPKVRSAPLACVVEYIGYGGGRGFPTDWLLWSSAGYAHFVMDTRGQGSVWRPGDTPDADGSAPQSPGFMTRGILDPKNYYYRRVFTDAVRAIEAARAHDAVDGTKIAVTGGSQGGGVALAVAALESGVSVLMADVPFLCHYRVATEITDSDPYHEISQYCQIHRDKIETVFSTLSYFDGVNFAARGKCKALFSVGLMDEVCPPRTVFAAYNHYAGPKEIRVWQYNHHEGGDAFQNVEKIKFLKHLWAD